MSVNCGCIGLVSGTWTARTFGDTCIICILRDFPLTFPRMVSATLTRDNWQRTPRTVAPTGDLSQGATHMAAVGTSDTVMEPLTQYMIEARDRELPPEAVLAG